MAGNWTFGQKLGAGFAVTVALAIASGAISITAIRGVVASKDRVIQVNDQVLIDAERVRASFERKVAKSQAFLLTRQEQFLEPMREARAELLAVFERLKHDLDTEESARLLGLVEQAEREHQEATDVVLALRRTDASLEEVGGMFEQRANPKREHMDAQIEALVARERQLLADANAASSQAASTAIKLLIAVATLIVILATAIAVLLSRALGRQIGTAASQVQSSSSELQSAANQQATSAKEQTTAMNEITTTISELMATSRQIAESAQRVAQIAEQTSSAARSGGGTMAKGHEAIAGIRRQVDLIVNHMLELGKKSQQIGAVLEIVTELSEQTNILAINATIEAAGAGESGKRFSVVAEEIRKLADRVGRSTKEIRGLIDDVRSAVNTTVMSTETGSKAVEAGTKQFAHVSDAFQQIAERVATASEAAKEIELSTKQQSSAVEQVNFAMTSVAQANKETEASTGQTLQTASQLAELSRALLLLVRRPTTARVRDDSHVWPA